MGIAIEKGEMLPAELDSYRLVAEMDRQSAVGAQFLQQEYGITPAVALLSNNPGYEPSQRYIKYKIKAAEKAGILAVPMIAPPGTDLRYTVEQLNEDPRFHAFFVQTPILSAGGTANASSQETQDLVNQILPEKDVDGQGVNSPYKSATARAIFAVLDAYGIGPGTPTTVLGRGRAVGEPTYQEGLCRDWDIRAFDKNSDRDEVIDALSESRLIVAATGTNLDALILDGIKSSRWPRIVIDAGCNPITSKGDISDTVRKRIIMHGGSVSKEIGAIGPATIRMLLDSVLEAAFLQISDLSSLVPRQRRERIEISPATAKDILGREDWGQQPLSRNPDADRHYLETEDETLDEQLEEEAVA